MSAVMQRYIQEFSTLLPDPQDEHLDAKTLLNGFIDGFKTKIVDQRNMSLCTMLTSNKPILPEAVGVELAAFYQLILGWLAKVFVRLEDVTEETGLMQASQLLACLHGASILVQGTNQPDFFHHALSDWRGRYL